MIHKRYIHLIIFFLLTFYSKVAIANVGGDITYVNLGSSKYKIIFKYYRHCMWKTAPATMDLGWFLGNNGSKGTTPKTVTMTRTTIRDITPVCSTASNPCGSPNSNRSGIGLEEQTYEATVDIGSSPFTGIGLGTTYCELTFFATYYNRSTTFTTAKGWAGTSTTGGAANFYTYATINICNLNKSTKKSNSTPTLTNTPINTACCNQAFYYNLGAIDTLDYDSFSYSMVQAKIDPTSMHAYDSPFTPRYPLTPYCVTTTTIKCTPDPKANPPKGIYFSESTGDLIFTPKKCDEFTLFVIGVTEWRKDTSNAWVKIGYTQRDIEFLTVDNCGYNNSPSIDGNEISKICEGETIKIKVSSNDETYVPFQTVPDTTALKWNSGIPGAQFTIAKKSDWPDKRKAYGEFQWTPPIGSASDVPYSFNVTVTDKHCPVPSSSTRTYLIKVLPRAQSTRKYTPLSCGLFVCSSILDKKFKGTPSFKWRITDSTGKIDLFQSRRQIDTFKFYRGGKYIVWHTVNNEFNCATLYKDTITLKNPPSVEIARTDTFSCLSSDIEFLAKIQHAQKPYRYYWTRIKKDTGALKPWKSEIHVSGDTFDQLTIKNLSTDSTIRITVTDSIGCVFFDTTTIKIKPLPIINLGPDQRICTYQTAQFDGQNADTVRYHWNTMDTTRVIRPNIAAKYILKVTEKNWLCSATDTISLFVNDTVQSFAGRDTQICHNQPIQLRASHKPAGLTATYSWLNLRNDSILGNNQSYIIVAKNPNTAGGSIDQNKFALTTTVIQSGHSCADIDSIQLKILTLPSVIWNPNPMQSRCYADGNFTVNPYFNLGNDPKSKFWAVEFNSTNHYKTKTSRSTNPSSGFVYNYIDSINPLKSVFTMTSLKNELLQNNRPFRAKLFAAYTDTLGCTNIDSVIQQINGNPIIQLIDSVFCQNRGAITMNEITVEPQSAANHHSFWSVLPNGFPKNIDSSNLLLRSYKNNITQWQFSFGSPSEDFYAGNYHFELLVRDSSTLCFSKDSVKLRVIAEPKIQISKPSDVCINGDTVNLYQRVLVNGFTANKTDGSQFELIEHNNIRLNPAISNFKLLSGHQFLPTYGVGNWLIRYSNNSTGCLLMDSFFLRVNDTPNAVLFSNDTICATTEQLDLNTKVNRMLTYPKMGIGYWESTQSLVKIADSAIFTPFSQGLPSNFEGPYTCKYHLIDSNGCEDIEDYTVTIQNQPTVSITTLNPANACENTPFLINVVSQYCDQKLEWKTLNHLDGSACDGTWTQQSNSENILFTHGKNDLSKKRAQLSVTTLPMLRDVCPAANDSIAIILNPNPILSNLTNQSGCLPLITFWSVDELNNLNSNQVTYSWELGLGKKSNLQIPGKVNYDLPGKFNIRVIATNDSGNCADTSISLVIAYPKPIANFTTTPEKPTVATPKIQMINLSTIDTNAFGNKLSFHWDFGDLKINSDTSLLRSPSYNYGKDTGKFDITLMATSPFSCADTITKSIRISPGITIYIPNAFTPNTSGPSANNTFKPIASGYSKGNFSIYNRWGEKLFETEDLTIGWTGKSNEQDDCPEGVYLYKLVIIDKDFQSYQYHGTFTLLR